MLNFLGLVLIAVAILVLAYSVEGVVRAINGVDED